MAVHRDIATRRDDAVERASIDHEILDDRKRLCAPGLDRDGVAVLEPPHVKLTHGRAAIRSVRNAVHDEAAHPADAFAAIGIECDGVFAALDEPLVDDVEHLKEGHIRRHAVGYVVH